MRSVLVFAVLVVLFFACASAQPGVCDPGEPFVQIANTASVAFRLDPEAQADHDKRSQPGLTNGQQLQITIADAMGINVDAVIVYRVTSTDAAVAICNGDIADFLNEVNEQCLYYPSPFADSILLNARVTGVSWDAGCSALPSLDFGDNGGNGNDDDDDDDDDAGEDDGEPATSDNNSVLVLHFKSNSASTLSAGLATLLMLVPLFL